MTNIKLTKRKVPSQQGFSLIELMVVMAIMSIMMGLTGALVTKTVDQQERQVELEKVQHLFKKLSYQAFYQGSAIKVSLERNQIQITKENSQKIITFKQLVFVAQNYTISTQAVTSPEQFSVFWKDTIRHFNVNTIYTPFETLNDAT